MARLRQLHRSVLCFVLLVLSLWATPFVAAASTSAACDAINARFGTLQTIAPIPNVAYPTTDSGSVLPGRYLNDYEYSGFAVGETISIVASSSGNGGDGHDSMLAIFDMDSNLIFEASNVTGVNFNENTSHTFTQSDVDNGLNSLLVKLDVINTNDHELTLTLQLTCSDGSTPVTPTITHVNPASGTTAGGTSIIISGTNFTGATAVTFDGIVGTGLTVNSATSITVTTPTNTAGVKDVVVTTPGGSVTSIGGYTYIAAPVAAPIFDEAPAITNISTTRLDLSASLDKAGRFYYVVLPDGATAPTAAQVKAGTASTGSQASHSGSAVISSSPFSHRFTISNLVSGTAYDIYVVAEDNASPANVMASPVKLDATMSTLNTLYFENGGETVTGLTGVSPAEFTVEFKLYLDSETPAGNWPAIYKENDDYGIFLEGDSSVSLWSGSNLFQSTSALRSDTWNHVAMTYSASTGFKIYINGVLNLEDNRDLSSSAQHILPLGNVSIGGGLVLTALDDFRIWNVVRTVQQINDSKNSELIPTYPASLVRYYDFNQGIGGADNTGFTSLDDRTRNGASGTLNNFSLIGTKSNWIESSSLLSTPFITSVAPATGSLDGGDSVIITGEFLTGATAVTFGGLAATSFSVDSETQITAIVPPHAAGVVDVSVTTAGGTVSSAGTFAYGDAPTAPTIETVTAGDGQVSVAFTEPVNNGGFAITDYIVAASPGGATATGAGSPITVSGLTNGTSYTFTVQATNAIGTSSPSAVSASVKPNAAPVISGVPATSVNQDVVYTFVPTASDPDGDTLTFNITNKPSWAAFDSATGTLTGTPAKADVGVTSGIVISVSDGSLSASLPAFNLEVVNVNEAPVISGTPLTSVNQDMVYTFVPTVSDPDGDVLTFSITNKPSWAAFDVATGTLTGTPAKADVGVTTSIVITVSDGTLSASLPAFNLEVVNVNEAPVISGTPLTSVNQDVAYSFTPTASDVDVGDVPTFSITNKPSWAAFDVATGTLTGTPAKADVGVTTSIVITVSDGTLSASLPAFNLEVVNVNEAPVISGTPLTSVNQDVVYTFVPTVSDPDGDVPIFSITNKPAWAVFNEATGALTGTPTHDHVGTTTGIVISVSDGVLSASLPAFNLEVVETIDPLQPVVTAPVDIDINAAGLYTPVSLRQLLSLNPSVTQEQVEAILNSLASDGVSGNTCCTTNPEGLNANNVLLLPPGRHEVTWRAANAADISGTATQVVSINPLVSLSKSQVNVRGNDLSFRVLLNGRSPVYPLHIPYVIDSTTTATAAEHNLVSGIASFTQQGQMEVVIPVSLADVSGFSDSQLVIALGDGINAGATNRHVIDIKSGNVPPVVNLSIAQGGVNTSLITASGGPVTVTASVFDANKGDTHSFDWSTTNGLADTDGNPVDAVRVIDPTGLSGTRQVTVIVTDSAGTSVLASIYFRVVAELPVLDPTKDSNHNGIDDVTEGTGDADDNGIPDYLDNMPSSNILPQQGDTTNAYLIECDPGVRCGLGLLARSGVSGGAQILEDELVSLDGIIVDPAFEPVGGIFDFVIRDLPTVGQSVRVAIPQRAPIPANAVYRKYNKGSWESFVVNVDNALHSAPGNPGYCPPPGSAEWQVGLVEGYLCVQLTIKDGGPNDDDGLENGAVVDPGTVSVALPVDPEPPTPEPPKPDVTLKSKGGGAIDGLWILLLGSILMMKWLGTKQRKGLAAVALLVTSVSSQALTDGKAFVRVDVYKAEGGVSESTFNQSLAAGGHAFSIDKYDVDRRAYQIAFGYQWHDYTYTELGYLDLGDVKVDMTLDGETNLPAFEYDLGKTYPVSGKGVTLVQGLTLLSDQPVNISLEVGAYVWRDEKSTNQNQITLKKDGGVAPLAGIRLDLGLTKSVSFGLSTRRIYLDDQVVSLYSLSGRYRF